MNGENMCRIGTGFSTLAHEDGSGNMSREEILSYFTTRVTNGPVEARNLTAKRIQRRGCGYRNFDNYKVRLLLIRTPSP